MQVDIETLISAARIAPGDKLYVVVLPNGHDTLRRGDVVKMVEVQPNGDNVFIRVADLTAHRLQSDGEYVIVVEKHS